MLQVEVNETHKIEVGESKEGILLNGEPFFGEIIKIKEGSYKVYNSNKIFRVDVVEQEGKQLKIKINNVLMSVSTTDHIDQILDKLGMDMTVATVVKDIKAPMPGTILAVKVKEGDEVQEGDQLLVLEAMKMENVIKSPGSGIVSKVVVQEKQNVEKNEVLISFE